MIKNVLLVICLAVSLFVWTSSGAVYKQSQAAKMQDRSVSEYQVDYVPTLLALQRLATVSGTPIGIEVLPENEEKPGTITISARGSSVRDILGLVMEKDPRYTWIEADSIISVFPKDHKDSFLETIIDRFEVADVNRLQAIRTLEEANELTKAGVKDRTLKSIPGDGQLDLPHFSLSLKRTSVRVILNAIMLSSHSKSWAFSRNKSPNSFSLTMR